MKTTPQQFESLRAALERHGPGRAVAIDTIVIANIVTDLLCLQQYEAASVAQFKAPLVKAYIADALTQAKELLATLQRAGGDARVDLLEMRPEP